MEILIVLLLLIGVSYVLLMLFLSKLRQRWSAVDREFVRKSWRKIRAMEDGRHAIMEADKLLDVALGKKGYQGSLGDKLKKNGNLFSDLNAVWRAHKVRNNLAHQLDYHLTESQITQALATFEKALKDLGLL